MEREVRRFSDANRAWRNAELLDLQPASTVEILERTRRLHERVQDYLTSAAENSPSWAQVLG